MRKTLSQMILIIFILCMSIVFYGCDLNQPVDEFTDASRKAEYSPNESAALPDGGTSVYGNHPTGVMEIRCM